MPRFTPEEEAAYEVARHEGNLSRLRLLLPLMTLTQLIVLPGTLAIEPGPLALVHLLSALGCGGMAAWCWWGPTRFLPPVVGFAWFLHTSGVVMASRHPVMTVFYLAVFGVGLILALRPLALVPIYTVGVCLTLVGAVWVHGPGQHLWLGMLAGTGGFALAMLLTVGRRRDFRQEFVIETQRKELESLNASLEDRVKEQVKALSRRADEVDRLNVQLQAQVKDRSRALHAALRRLASAEPAQALEGRVIGERFSVGPVLARGGMGAVHEGIDLSTDATVAIKVILGTHAPITMLQRFLDEAESAASIVHPAIVSMLHVDIDEDGTFFQVQEFVRGETLQAALERLGPFTVSATRSVLHVLADALAAAHAGGVVHRDIKPANLILTRSEPGLKVVDFGIAQLDSSDADLTQTGAMVGTPRYMSPEQRVDASTVTDRSDVYAVALVTLLMARGSLLQPGESTPFADMGFSDGALLDRCLHRDAAERPSARALADATQDAPALHGLVEWDGLATEA